MTCDARGRKFYRAAAIDEMEGREGWVAGWVGGEERKGESRRVGRQPRVG